MTVADYNDADYPTGYDNGPGQNYAPDRGGAQIIPPEAYARPAPAFGAAGYPARAPRVPTSSLEGNRFTAAGTRPVPPSAFSAAEMPVDRQFSQASDAVALRAMGRGPAEHAGDHQIIAGTPPPPTGEELLDRVAPGWRAAASQTYQPEMPSFGEPGSGGFNWRRRPGSGGSAGNGGSAGEEPEAGTGEGNASGPRAS